MAVGYHIAAGESGLEVGMVEDTAHRGLGPGVVEESAYLGSPVQMAFDPAQGLEQQRSGAVVSIRLETC